MERSAAMGGRIAPRQMGVQKLHTSSGDRVCGGHHRPPNAYLGVQGVGSLSWTRVEPTSQNPTTTNQPQQGLLLGLAPHARWWCGGQDPALHGRCQLQAPCATPCIVGEHPDTATVPPPPQPRPNSTSRPNNNMDESLSTSGAGPQASARTHCTLPVCGHITAYPILARPSPTHPGSSTPHLQTNCTPPNLAPPPPPSSTSSLTLLPLCPPPIL